MTWLDILIVVWLVTAFLNWGDNLAFSTHMIIANIYIAAAIVVEQIGGLIQ